MVAHLGQSLTISAPHPLATSRRIGIAGRPALRGDSVWPLVLSIDFEAELIFTIMKYLVPDKDVRKLLARHPELEVTRTDHHMRVRHRGTGDFIIISLTSSDWRSLRKVERDLEHLRSGMGYLQRAAHRRRPDKAR